MEPAWGKCLAVTDDAFGDIEAVRVHAAFDERADEQAHAATDIEHIAPAAGCDDVIGQQSRVSERVRPPAIRSGPVVVVFPLVIHGSWGGWGSSVTEPFPHTTGDWENRVMRVGISAGAANGREWTRMEGQEEEPDRR